MLETLDWKMTVAALAIIVSNASFIPYFIDIFQKRTTPHSYSWLIWSITQGVGAAGLWYGEAGLVAVGLTITAILVLLIFLLSLRYGTKHITLSDTLILLAALVAVAFWLFLDHPVWAVILVSLIEVLGFIPTYRKSLIDPYSENVPAWSAFFVGGLLSLLALTHYNFLTVTYLATMTAASLILIVICVAKRTRKT